MRRAALEEVIRVLVQTAGDAEVRQLVDSFRDLGDVAEAEGEGAERALRGIADTAQRIGQIDAFVALKRDLVATESELSKAQAAAQALFAEYGAGEERTAGVKRQQQAARKAVLDLAAAAEEQRIALQRARNELGQSGIDTTRLAVAQSALNKQLAAGRAALAGEVQDIRRLRAEQQAAAAASAALKQRMAEEDAEFRRGNLARRAAAAALEAYRKRAADAAEATARARREAASLGSTFGNLRGLAAGAAAFFGFQGAAEGALNILRVAAAAEDTRRALGNLYGSQAEGNRAFAELQQIADRSGLAMGAVAEQAKRLKAFGIDPLNGSLQALIDENAAIGGSMERLEGVVLAFGQAWAKQKLQGEEALQLAERGIPVWDLLAKVTGKNVAEVQKLSEQGKLGRDVIQALYEEIGRANTGAAERSLGGLSGLFAQVAARWEKFQRQIADAGVADFFKQEIDSLLGSTRDTEGVAKRVADAIINAYRVVKDLATALAPVVAGLGRLTTAALENANAVVLLAKVWAGLKVAQLAQGFAQAATSMLATTAATQGLAASATGAIGPVGRLAGALKLLRGGVVIGLAVTGVEQAIKGLGYARAAVLELQAAENQRAVNAFRLEETQRELVRTSEQLTRLYAQYADTVVRGGADISAMTREQAQDYTFALEQAQQYYRGLEAGARAARDELGQQQAVEQFERLQGAIDATRARLDELTAAAAKQGAFDAFANSAVEKFDQIVGKGESARKAVSGIFEGLDLARADGLQRAVDIVDQIAARGAVARDAIGAELRKAIAAVADEDLPRLEEAAAKAMAAGTDGAGLFAEALQSVNLTRLGVDVEAIKTGFTAAGRAAVDQFGRATAEVRKLGLTAQQQSKAIAQAFDGAFKQLTTGEEVKALQDALRDAAQAGTISTAEYNAKLAETQRKLREIQGEAEATGAAVESGADRGREALTGLADAADEASDRLRNVGDSAQQAGGDVVSGMAAVPGAMQAVSGSISGVSQRFVDLIHQVNNLELGNAFREQQADVQQAVRSLNAQLDEFEQKASGLGSRLNRSFLVDDAAFAEVERLQKAIADKRTELSDKLAADLKSSTEEYKRQLEAQAAAAGAALSQDTGTDDKPFVVELRGRGAAGSLDGMTDAEVSRLAQRLARPIAAPILQQIARSRANSNLVVRGRR